jgi:hypothetical protein
MVNNHCNEYLAWDKNMHKSAKPHPHSFLREQLKEGIVNDKSAKPSTPPSPPLGSTAHPLDAYCLQHKQDACGERRLQMLVRV